MHTSVFLKEAIRELSVKPGGRYIDATFGEGGHAKEIIHAGGHVLGIEADQRQYQKHLNSSITVAYGNFRDIAAIAKQKRFFPVDGILFDLGLSMEQLNMSRRGFSFRKPEEPLDMRIEESMVTAAEILQRTNREELAGLLMKYSEDPLAEQIAHQIVSIRNRVRMETVADLTDVIRQVMTKKGITSVPVIEKTYARIFQALRIYVNDEFESLRKALNSSIELLVLGGRIVIITFHSLEDRIVKLFAREHAGEITQVRIKVNKERKLQKFERSAELRVFEKII